MLEFTKMHGLGNDFIVVNNLDQLQKLDSDRIRLLADRHFGIGFDQLLLVEPASVDNAEFDYRIFNCDGAEVEHCGNGARCFAKYVFDKGLSKNRVIRVNTAGGLITLRIQSEDRVLVEMGVPEFNPADIPIHASAEALDYSLELDIGGQLHPIRFGALSIGNPHITVLVDDIDRAPVESWGPILESHPLFPNRINVGFMQVVDNACARVRVFERGVGETRACGSGACAAAVYGIRKKLLDKSSVLTLPGGELKIFWPGGHNNVEMTGPCATVFEGQTKM